MSLINIIYADTFAWNVALHLGMRELQCLDLGTTIHVDRNNVRKEFKLPSEISRECASTFEVRQLCKILTFKHVL